MTTRAEQVTEQEMEDGIARANLHRLIRELAKARNTSFHGVQTGLMRTQAWKRAGKPDPKHITAPQVAELVPILERQIEKARAGDVPSRRPASHAPVPPWAGGGDDAHERQ